MVVRAEVSHLTAPRLGASVEPRSLGGVGAGEIVGESIHPADWARESELVARYRDLPLGPSTAPRPRHREGFTLLP